MRKIIVLKACLSCLCLTALSVVSSAQTQEMPGRIQVMRNEISRNFGALQKEPAPPYYLSYSIDEVRTQYVTAAFGAVTGKNDDIISYLRINLRTGSYKLDNSHEIRGDSLGAIRSRLSIPIRAPLGDSPEGLALILWKETDKAYKNAVETLSRVKSEQSVKIAEEDRSDDFSKVDPHQSVAQPLNIRVDLEKWADRVRKYSELFKHQPHVYDSSSVFQSEVRHKYFVDTEGTVVSSPVNYMRLSISANTKADDGMELPLYLSYFGYKESDFPPEDAILSDIGKMIDTMQKLRAAPIVEPYAGPAILAGKASGVFFHEILGHRLEGHRIKSESDAQTFKKKVGEKILPDFISIIFDPTLRELDGLLLSGAYAYDDEGTKGERVVSIKNGVLQDFLMSRTPADKFPRSNGHGRSQPGMKPVSRQSNLIVESTNILPDDKLRQLLIEECRKQNKPFGLLFTEIAGGSTNISRSSANVFNVIPLVVYRIYTNGQPDEIVRGVDMIGTPLTVFGKIMATGSKMEVFNGTCGAESGGVPVSGVSPSVLVSEIEVQKKAKSQEKPPILPSPAKTIASQERGEP